MSQLASSQTNSILVVLPELSFHGRVRERAEMNSAVGVSRRLRAGEPLRSQSTPSGTARCLFGAVLGDIDGALSSLLERGLRKLFARRVARATLGVECILAELHELFFEVFCALLAFFSARFAFFAIHVGADILAAFLDVSLPFTRAFLTFSQWRTLFTCVLGGLEYFLRFFLTLGRCEYPIDGLGAFAQ